MLMTTNDEQQIPMTDVKSPNFADSTAKIAILRFSQQRSGRIRHCSIIATPKKTFTSKLGVKVSLFGCVASQTDNQFNVQQIDYNLSIAEKHIPCRLKEVEAWLWRRCIISDVMGTCWKTNAFGQPAYSPSSRKKFDELIAGVNHKQKEKARDQHQLHKVLGHWKSNMCIMWNFCLGYCAFVSVGKANFNQVAFGAPACIKRRMARSLCKRFMANGHQALPASL